jgi:pSer/pThr/pTyr-binding forkhead associated (FHA) protein
VSDAERLHQSTPAELRDRIEAQRAGTPFLCFRGDDGAQHIVTLTGDAARLSVGRDTSADIALTWDRRVSRLHVILECTGGVWTAEDDGLSRNGTFVNLERVAGRRRLHPGDTIRVGDTDIEYWAQDRERSDETSLADDVVLDGDLSKMQRKVLTALCRPLHVKGPYASPATNQEIADEVFLTVVAVKTHLRTLFAKFGLGGLPQNSKRAALAEAALKSGAVSERDFARDR